MILGGKGGGNTKTGLFFEKDADLIRLLDKIEGYSVKNLGKRGSEIYFKEEKVAFIYKKHQFYTFLEENGVEWDKILSKRLLPDDALIVIVRETLYILEVKFQKVAGSVDEKLQTCDFKRKQYAKLTASLGLKVEYVYVLTDWFKHPAYKDVLDYINSVNCHYRFNSLPLALLGLPS